MDSNQILVEVRSKFAQSVEHFVDELKKIRTGRATPAMLDGIMVEAYGSPMPLIQVASIATPEPQMLQLTPFDPSNLQAITTAIRENTSLGLNPVDDGRVIRVSVPPLTTERRQEIAKQLRTKVEDCMVRLRQLRHEALKTAEAAKKDKQLTEDDYKSLQKQLDELMHEQKQHVEELTKTKEHEILTV